MEHAVRDLPVHYVEPGDGLTVLALHGASVDHREAMAFLEPVFDRGVARTGVARGAGTHLRRGPAAAGFRHCCRLRASPRRPTQDSPPARRLEVAVMAAAVASLLLYFSPWGASAVRWATVMLD
jgi:hypothetical protein